MNLLATDVSCAEPWRPSRHLTGETDWLMVQRRVKLFGFLEGETRGGVRRLPE